MKKLLPVIAASAFTALGLCVQSKAADLNMAMVVPAAAVMASDRKAVASVVTEANVFFNGAELTHIARAQLEAGANEITIEGLSPYIDMNSLRIKVSDNVVVAASEFSVDYINTAREQKPMLAELEKKIAGKTAQIEKVDIDRRINENMLTMLREGIAKNVSGSEKGLGTDELKKTLDYYKSKSEELEAERAKLNTARAELQKELDGLRNQYNQESVKGSKTSGILRLNLSSPAVVNAAFSITYFTPQAGWVPYYDINIASTDKPVKIIARSKVFQTTGLDWDKVKLTLSTAQPSSGNVAPLFSAWFLQPAVQHPRATGREGSSMKMAGMAVQNTYSYNEEVMEIAADAPIMEQSTMERYVTASDNDLNVTYQIDMPYSIPGNGKEQRIDLLTTEATAQYKYYATPKLDSRTYLIAEIADWQKLGLLSASANITYDGTYIGETYIDASSTNEKLTLTLGTDARVSVKREKLQDFSSSRTLGGDVQQVFTYRITVKNNQNRTVKLVTKDQYPISTQKNIDVTLRTKETTKWTANVEELGVITWEDELAPGETKVYEISYSVKYPKDMKLNL